MIDASIVPRKVRRKTDRGSAGFGSTGVAAAAPTVGSKLFEFPMPREELSLSHRPEHYSAHPPLYVCVARPVNKKEQAANATARAALQKEWDGLTSQNVGICLPSGNGPTSPRKLGVNCLKMIPTGSIKGG